MYWCTLNNNYHSYISSIENKIPKINYGANSFKPFFSPLFEKNGLVYISQVTSPKPRHNKINAIDMVKLYDNNKKIIGVVNLNYMFPIKQRDIIIVNYKNIGKQRTFLSEQDKNAYIKLLKMEMAEIKRIDISTKAIAIYNLVEQNPNHAVSKRCFDFKKLEQACDRYYYYNHLKDNCEYRPIIASTTTQQMLKQLHKECDCISMPKGAGYQIAIHKDSIVRADEIIKSYEPSRELVKSR